MTWACTTVDSPAGELVLVAEDGILREILFERGARGFEPGVGWRTSARVLDQTARQLGDYFSGRREDFDLPLGPLGTPFQVQVWSELARIPYGATITYGELARRVGNPRASRAVGAANGKNPIPIVIPCHRVIGSDGRLTGFGGGLDKKRILLELEGNATGLFSS